MYPFDLICLDEVEVAELLVKNGGKTKYVSPNGRKPLDYAVIHSKKKINHITAT